MLISLSGPSGSGKTLSGILLAAGMVKPGEEVGMIDAENGRGTLYQDDPLVLKALPDSYHYTQISAPYTPSRYVMALTAMEKAGVTVCLIDSTSHEWEGEGGCIDIAENNKLKGMPNWALAKREHKKFLAYCLSSPMHIIFCLRAREKMKIVKDANGKDQFIPVGMTPIAEKNFVFEQLLSLMFDEKTHHYSGVKVPQMLAGMFPGNELMTKNHGAAIREWADGGQAVNPVTLLQKRARSAAELGMSEYSTFYGSLTVQQKKTLADTTHAENKAIAEAADAERRAAEKTDEPPSDTFAPFIEYEKIDAKLFWRVLGNLGYGELKDIPMNARETALQLVAKEFEQVKAA
jgi:hypothetical protein